MQNTQTQTPSTATTSVRHGNLILAATIMATGLVYLDATIITVALPQIQKDFSASLSNLQWLIDIYLLFLTVPILVAGSLSDRYGRKKLFCIGLAGFTIASVVCGAASALEQLILARVVQGIAGAMMLPGSLAILNATFPAETRGKVVGTWAAFTPVATAMGPLLGGWLVDNVSWRAAFFINLPAGLAAFYLAMRYVPESKSKVVPPKQDWAGAGLITGALGGLIFGVIEGPKRGWADPSVWIFLFISLVCLVGFYLVETRSQHPMVPFWLFKNRMFSGVTLMTFVLYFAISGVFFFLTLNLQQVQQFSATTAGAAFMPIIILLFLVSRWSGVLSDKIGPRPLMIIGPVIIAIGFFMYMLPSAQANYWLTFLPATIVFGLGLGIITAPLTVVAMGAVPTHLSGLASGVSNAVTRVATMLAVAVLGAVMVLQFGASLKNDTHTLPLSVEQRQFLEIEALKMGAAEPPPNLPAETTHAVQAAIGESFVTAFGLMMALCGVLALVSAAIAAMTISNQITLHDERVMPGLEVSLEAGLVVPAAAESDEDETQLPDVNGHSHYAPREWYEPPHPAPPEE